MDKITVNYKLTIYKNDLEVTIINNLTEIIPSSVIFTDMITLLVKKSGIKHFQLHVENLKRNTWEKIVGSNLAKYIDGDNLHYQWLNYSIGNIQDVFQLFDNEINIIINLTGFGKSVGENEGIKFIINPNERDRHQFEPHVHCEYSGEKMRIRLDTLEIMGKDKAFRNSKKVKKAMQWVEKNQTKLIDCYNSLNEVKDNDIKFEANI